jgi:hypothetical protein
MPAGVAANALSIEFFVEIPLTHILVHDFAEGRHGRTPVPIF